MESRTDSITTVFTMYDDLIHKECGYAQRVQWNRRNLVNIGKSVINFKRKVWIHSEKYNVLKWGP